MAASPIRGAPCIIQTDLVMNRLFATLALCLLAAMLPAACTTMGTQADIERLRQHLEANPNDAEALCDLGVLYARTRRFDEARPYLARAYAQDSSDARTMLYHGLALEAAGQEAAALGVYAGYRRTPLLAPDRRRIAARYKVLVGKKAREEIQARMAQEANFQPAPPNTVAVFPLTFQGGDERYAPLGAGLSQMIAIDLSQVAALTVLERERLDVLIQELELTQNDAFDASTAPRMGRLLAAERLIGGSFTVLDGDRLRVDAVSTAINEAPAQDLTRSDALANLFALEKDLVFDLIDRLGLELTQAERERIERVPTNNLQAFLAYSMGLQLEAAQDFRGAQAQFERAQRLDPNLDLAIDKANTVSVVDEMSGNPEDIAADASSPADDLVDGVIENIGNNMNTMVPSQDTNNTPGGETVDVALPRPQPPPPRGN